jgi:hypothetical protein
MKTAFLLLAWAGALAAQTPFTYESATECMSAAQLDPNPSVDDVVVLDRATGVLRLGRWTGTTLEWEVAPGGVAPAEFMSVGNLAADPGQPMSVAVGSAAWNRVEVFTPATNERRSISGEHPLPTAMVALPLPSAGDTALDDFMIAATDEGLAAYRNNGSFTAPSSLGGAAAGKLTSGNRVSTFFGTAAVFKADGTALEIRRWDGAVLMTDATLTGLDADSRHTAGRFGGSGYSSYIVHVPGENSFLHVAQQSGGGGAPFDTPATWPADFPIGSAYALSSQIFTSNDWLLLVSVDGATAQLLDFTLGGGPVLRQAFTAPPGTSFTAALSQPGGNFILLNGSGGRSSGWQRAGFDGNAHTLSASLPMPAIRRTSAVATLFAYSAEPWVDPSAELLSLRRVGDWTVSAMPGSAAFLNDLGVPSGLGSPASTSLPGLGASFNLPSQVRADASLATLGPALNGTRPAVVFAPPPGDYRQPEDAGGLPVPLKVTLTAEGRPADSIRFRIDGGPWQSYAPDAAPPVAPALASSALLEAFAELPGGVHSAVARGQYAIGATSPLATAPFVDENNDGIDDRWAEAMGVSSATEDRDGDGADAKAEHDAGTDPNDPNSHPGTLPGDPVLVITGFDPLGRVASLRLHGRPGILHRVEWSADLGAGSWQPLGSDVMIPGQGFIDLEDHVAASPRRFYRATCP